MGRTSLVLKHREDFHPAEGGTSDVRLVARVCTRKECPQGLYPAFMATHTRRELDLLEVVKRARRQAERSGELLATPSGRPSDSIDPEARAALARWAAGGGYERALDVVIAADPDLADQ